MLICENCGKVIEENELGSHREYRGECMGTDAYEKVPNDCSCGGQYVEAEKCEICDEWKPSFEIVHNICIKCLKKKATTQKAISYAVRDNKEEIKINSFLAYCFQGNQIEQILEREILSAPQKYYQLAKEFCLADEWDFAEWLLNDEQE